MLTVKSNAWIANEMRATISSLRVGVEEECSWCYSKVSFKIYRECSYSTTQILTFQVLKDTYLTDWRGSSQKGSEPGGDGFLGSADHAWGLYWLRSTTSGQHSSAGPPGSCWFASSYSQRRPQTCSLWLPTCCWLVDKVWYGKCAWTAW